MKKHELLRDLTDCFRQYGYEGVTLSLISKKTGLGKASLYHHFPNGKEEMAISIVEDIMLKIKNMQKKIEDRELNPKDSLKEFLNFLSEFYDNGKKTCIIDILSLESTPKKIIHNVQIVLETLLKYFEFLFKKMGNNQQKSREKSKEALILIQGALVLTRSFYDESAFIYAIEKIKSL